MYVYLVTTPNDACPCDQNCTAWLPHTCVWDCMGVIDFYAGCMTPDNSVCSH